MWSGLKDAVQHVATELLEDEEETGSSEYEEEEGESHSDDEDIDDIEGANEEERRQRQERRKRLLDEAAALSDDEDVLNPGSGKEISREMMNFEGVERPFRRENLKQDERGDAAATVPESPFREKKKTPDGDSGSERRINHGQRDSNGEEGAGGKSKGFVDPHDDEDNGKVATKKIDAKPEVEPSVVVSFDRENIEKRAEIRRNHRAHVERIEHRLRSIESVLTRTENALPSDGDDDVAAEFRDGEDASGPPAVALHAILEFLVRVGGPKVDECDSTNGVVLRNALERCAADLCLERQTRKDQIDSLSARLVREESAHRELEQKVESLSNRTKLLTHQKKEATREFSLSTRETARAEQRLRVAIRDRRKAQKELEEVQESLKFVRDENQVLRERITEAREDETIESLESKIGELEDTLEEADERDRRREKEAVDMQQEANSQKKRALELERELVAVSADLKLKEGDLSSTRESMQRLETVLRQFEKKRRRSESNARDALKNAEERAESAEAKVASAVANAIAKEKLMTHAEKTRLAEERDAAIRQSRALRDSLDGAMRQLKSMNEENLVDKRLVSKLLMTYFERGCTDEVLDIMSRIVGFSNADRERLRKLSRRATGGLVSSIFSTIGASSRPAASPLELDRLKSAASENGSFIDAWAEFLIREAEQGSSNRGNMSSKRSSRLSDAGTDKSFTTTTTPTKSLSSTRRPTTPPLPRVEEADTRTSTLASLSKDDDDAFELFIHGDPSGGDVGIAVGSSGE